MNGANNICIIAQVYDMAGGARIKVSICQLLSSVV